MSSVQPGRLHLRLPAILGLAGAFLLLALTFRTVIDGDGVGYYTFLHAFFVSHGLAYDSEYSAAIASHTPLFLPWLTERTSAGHLTDRFPVGSAMLAAPAYLVALLLHPSGEPQYGSPFVESFTLASLFFGLIGIALAYRMTAVLVSRRAALIGALGGIFATPFVFYLLTDPSYSHTFSVFSVSAFLYAWWKGPPRSFAGWLGLGALGGLMAVTRWQDGALMAIVLVDIRRLRWQVLFMIPAALVVFAPQFAVDQAQFGSWLPERPPGQAPDPLHGHYLDALFSSQYGLFVWTPAAGLAAIGSFFLKDRRLRAACLVAFVVEAAIIGSVPDWPGPSFGPRRFLGLVPFAVLGMAALADRIGRWADWVPVGLACAWNIVLLANFEYVMPGVTDPGYAGLIRGQLTALAFVPRLLAKGSVVRDLVLWSPAHTRFDLVGGVTLAVLEAVCLVAAAAVAAWPRSVGFKGRPSEG